MISLRNYIVALIHLYLQLFLCTQIFSNSCKTLSYILTHVTNKKRLDYNYNCNIIIIIIIIVSCNLLTLHQESLKYFAFKLVFLLLTMGGIMMYFSLYLMCMKQKPSQMNVPVRREKYMYDARNSSVRSRQTSSISKRKIQSS